MNQSEFEKVLNRIADRSRDVRATANSMLEAWSFDLEARRPGVAYVTENGTQVTSLDMACVLTKLVEWGSVIDLPTYGALGPATKKKGEIVTSKEHRHGKITGLNGNQSVFNFSIRIIDANVMTAKKVGEFRNFLLMHDREWHQGFRSLTFIPTEMEKKLLARIPSNGNTTMFDYFISPNRWPSIYGRYYLAAKTLIVRLKEQISFLGKEVKRIIKALSIETEPWPKTTKGASAPKKVWSFEALVEGAPELHGEFQSFPATSDGLDDARALKQRLTQIRDQLTFQTRATEFSFFNKVVSRFGQSDEKLIEWVKNGIDDEFIPKAAWVKDLWQAGWKESPRHKPWVRIDGLSGLSLRWVAGKKTIQVAPSQIE